MYEDEDMLVACIVGIFIGLTVMSGIWYVVDQYDNSSASYVKDHVCFDGKYIFKLNYDFDGNNLEYTTICYEIMNYTSIWNLPGTVTGEVSVEVEK